MTPFVAVEVSPTKAPGDRNLLALLRACSQAVPRGACELRAGGESDGAEAIASVVWDADGNAHIGLRLHDSERDLTRTLTFASTDPELQRWRSVGLAIATIVDELEVRREAVQAAAAAPPTPVVQAAASPVPPAPVKPAPATRTGREAGAESGRKRPVTAHLPSSTQLELGGMGGTGLAGAGYRGGVYARGARDLAGLPAFASVMLSYALSSSEAPPSVTWTELALGGGFYVELAPVRLELSAQLELLRTSASARAPAGNTIDSGGRWLPAAALGVHAVWPAGSPLGALIGARGEWSAREVTVTNAGREIGRVPTYSVGALAGVRFTF